MTAFCQCQFQTASYAGAEGETRGVLLCAVCNAPKRRDFGDIALGYEDTAKATGIPLKTLRTLVATGSIKPAIREPSCVRFYPAHVRAQLSQKGIKR